MTTKKSEVGKSRTLRSRSITRGRPSGADMDIIDKSPSRGRGRPNNSGAVSAPATTERSAGRAGRTKSPARTKELAVELESVKRAVPKSPPSTPTVKRTKPAQQPTPTRQSVRQAEKQLMVESNKTNEKLQKFVDEFYAGGDSKKDSGSKTGAVPVNSGGIFLVIVLLAVMFLCGTACNLTSCSLTSWPQLPTTLEAYLDLKSFGFASAFFVLQVLLAAVPIGCVIGRGTEHECRINGFMGLIVSSSLLAVAYYFKRPVFEILSEKFLALFIANSIVALLFAIWLYLQRSPAAKKQSEGFLTTFCTGSETQPRLLFGLVNVKMLLGFNVSIIGWVLLEAIIIVEAYQRATPFNHTFIVLAGCHAIFVLDYSFFQSTMSTMMYYRYEGVGLVISLRMFIEVPLVHSLALRYLLQNPQQWSDLALGGFILLFLIGLVLHRVAAYQKYSYRSNPHHPSFSAYDVIPSPSGRSLLCSGTLWGRCRHPNYLGSIITCTALVLPLGPSCPLAYIYPLFVTLGLLYRARMDEIVCKVVHSTAWDRYTERVRYRLIPYIF